MPGTYVTDLATHLTGLLAASPDKAVLVASVQECLLTLVTGGGIDPTIVGATSVTSLNVVTGQLLLEELVLQSPTPSAWTELQHVLQVVENEPLRMAVASALNAQLPEATKALEAQLKGDVLGAIKLYGEAEAKLQANVVSCSPMERQRWATERISCIAQLNKWDALASELVVDDVWSLPEPFRGQQVRHLVMAYGATDQVETLLTHMTPERLSDVTRTCPELFGFVQLQGPPTAGRDYDRRALFRRVRRAVDELAGVLSPSPATTTAAYRASRVASARARGERHCSVHAPVGQRDAAAAR